MALTGYEKPLNDYTKDQLVEIAKSYTIYYKSSSGQGKIGGYNRLTKNQLISIIKNDRDYIDANPRGPRLPGDRRGNGNRFEDFKESLMGSEKSDDLMNIILSILSGSEVPYPVSGRYYTFVYYAKTPRILYDRYPLIMAGDPLPKGFRGFNYHFEKLSRGSPFRQYNTVDGDRLVSGLYELSQKEFETLRSVPYAKFIQN